MVCRQLGLGNKGMAYLNTEVPDSTPFWLQNVDCKGDEATLAACAHSGYGAVRGCRSNTAAAVLCYNDGKNGVHLNKRLTDITNTLLKTPKEVILPFLQLQCFYL